MNPENFDFESQRKEWLEIPLDDITYMNTATLLAMSDEELLDLSNTFERNRYQGWRNWNNLWRSTLGLDTTTGKTILDFGCGFGMEALQFAKAGNTVWVADINPEVTQLARRVLNLHGYEAGEVLIQPDYPFIPDRKIDIFYSNGVLHHTPKCKEIVQRATELLSPGGEIRLLLYSDKGRDIAEESGQDFVFYFDRVGQYADWYDEAKLKTFPVQITELTYITHDKRYLTTTMKKR